MNMDMQIGKNAAENGMNYNFEEKCKKVKVGVCILPGLSIPGNKRRAILDD